MCQTLRVLTLATREQPQTAGQVTQGDSVEHKGHFSMLAPESTRSASAPVAYCTAMGKITDLEEARLARQITDASEDLADPCELQPYELGFLEALLWKQGVKWGTATVDQFEIALRELDLFVRTEREGTLPE